MKAAWFKTLMSLVGSGAALSPDIRNAGFSASNLDTPEVLHPRSFAHFGSQRVRINYGRFTVPPATEENGVKRFSLQTAPPCKDCLLTRIRADLQHPDGTGSANRDTDVWLRHVLVTNLERDSATCPLLAAPIYASGNERAEADISLGSTLKAGYPLSPTAILIFTLKLMNPSPTTAQAAVLTMDWEFVPCPRAAASGFRNATPVWLDIDGSCLQHGSEVPVPAVGGGGGGGGGGAQVPFSLAMDPPWTADLSGEVVLVLAHLQDGGVELDVWRGARTVCRSVARYGEEERGRHGGGGGGGGGGGRDAVAGRHLSGMSACERIGRVAPGDRWSVRADYDFARHAPVMEGAAPAPVMGTALMYVLEDGE
ncbi:d5cff490-3fb3-4135-bff6-fb71d2379c06 [Thermothielavioides terrestris]|uniref:LDB19 N-terminal domain-containing protein n=2 Tax=Thermothielavioides terrestris TaxID=2587410 RepID=G2QQW3_THETT|nr:uncharacterized protein THITE_2109939 [Thermothielavioides terrestris NRRL 8126]AEO64122.1 hypothetical protein THITE_2109939 [Thermothielavioides terrestris NRRL 8126]SPQ27023.1 d5cff490-3fb3-4135-bff6-fb71d2379c06 [Thermothielavioides terrestris]